MNIPNIPYKRCYDCIIHKLIEQRAYEVYEFRKEYSEEGNAESDWFFAENEIINKLAELVVEKASKKLKDNL